MAAVHCGRAILASALIITAGLGAAREASAQTPLSVCVFPGGSNWPIWIAQTNGYFAKGGIEVKLTYTPNSVFQLTGLIEGKFDIAQTAVDNVIAYTEGQGEVPVATVPELFAFMGGDDGLLSLAVTPDIRTYQDLKGRTLAVDAMTTGYAFVLFDMLRRNGLNSGAYKVEKAGGVLARWEALKAGKFAGTMLVTPFDIMAKAAHLNILQYAIDVYGHYQGLVGAARRGWARDNRPRLVAYVRGYLDGLAWLFDKPNRKSAIEILRANLPDMTPELAEQSYEAMVGPAGIAPQAQIDLDGIRTVLELRNRYGEPNQTFVDAGKYYDPQYYRAALAN